MARKAKQPKGKKMNSTFFVFCEGKTEGAYVDLLRRNFRVPVEIITRLSDSNISQTYIDRCKRDRFTTPADKTFLMFDLDVAGMLTRLKKIKEATLLLSNPYIEYWFLLHYTDVNRELSTEECLSLLKRKDTDYSKGVFSTAMKKHLLENFNDAIVRADNKDPYANPSSTVYRLIREMRVE